MRVVQPAFPGAVGPPGAGDDGARLSGGRLRRPLPLDHSTRRRSWQLRPSASHAPVAQRRDPTRAAHVAELNDTGHVATPRHAARVSRWVRRSRAPPSRSGLLTVNMNDSPARIDPEEAAIGRPTQTARRLVEASVSPNTRRAYAGTLRRLDAWLDGRPLHDVTLAAYLAELHDAGRASSSASMAVAAACFRAKFAGQPTPAGERTARVLAGYRRTAGERGRGQARPFGAADLAAVLATCHRPRRRGRGVESDQVALERGRLDAVIAGVALHGRDAAQRGKRAALGPTLPIRQTGRYARHRATASRAPSARCAPLRVRSRATAWCRCRPQMVGLRFTAAALAAGVEKRMTAHSGRVGLASELTSRGASTTDVMLAGNWRTSRMVAHYSAGATAERCRLVDVVDLMARPPLLPPRRLRRTASSAGDRGPGPSHQICRPLNGPPPRSDPSDAHSRRPPSPQHTAAATPPVRRGPKNCASPNRCR